MRQRVLVAGIGNIFLGDDGFGVEVARRLAREELPDGTRVTDYGIRGMHLAYDLAEGWDATILGQSAWSRSERADRFAVLFTRSIYKWVQSPLALHVGSLDLDRERALQLPVVQKNEWGRGA